MTCKRFGTWKSKFRALFVVSIGIGLVILLIGLKLLTQVTLEVKGETQLTNLAKKLEAGGVAHKLWMEQPENYPTCLATKPYRKSEVASVFKSLKLCR